MKQVRCPVPPRRTFVAPRAGAWIETGKGSPLARAVIVAPRAGAWIETSSDFFGLLIVLRRPPRGGVD